MHPDDAARSLTNVLALAPDCPDAIWLLGVAAKIRGDHGTAVTCFRRLLGLWPEDAAVEGALGMALCENDATMEGIGHLQRACELAPASATAWFNLGEALKRNAHPAEAIDALQHALSLDPAHVPARLGLANAQSSAGQVDAAVRELREVLRRDPHDARAWFGLSNLNTVRFDAADVARIREAFERSGLTAEAHDLLGFALAKALEDQGDYAQAFDELRAVNASQRKRINWDAADSRRCVEATLKVLAGWNPPKPLEPELGREAIILVSIPRSGSTLVEHILASHPEVEGANEIRDMPQVLGAEAKRRGGPFPAWVPDARPEDWHRLGKEYLARTARWRERKPRFVDKNLVGWYWVGAVLAMLPAARVVVVRRDPLEACLACYRQRFTSDAGFTSDLDEMADYCIDFMRLTRFWLQKFPDRVSDLEYESLVRESESTIRRLLDFCGLPFDRACLDFHRTERAVLSAPSAAQVRQPLRRDTARAARYGDKLDPLRERLRGAGLLPQS